MEPLLLAGRELRRSKGRFGLLTRSLMNEPKLVLVDEPTSSLDTKSGEAVMELLREEITGRGIAAIVVTHDTRMTSSTDRTVEIVDGCLQA